MSKEQQQINDLKQLLKITYEAWDNGKPIDNHIVEDIHAFISTQKPAKDE